METSVAFNKMVELALALDVRNIKDYPSAWVQKVDDEWTIAINGKDNPVIVMPEGCMTATVKPFEAAVFYNGWLAASLSPVDGVFIAGGGANEDSFIAAVDAAIARAQRRAVAAV